MNTRWPCPSDVCDDEWAFIAPYLTLMTRTSQHDCPLREVINGTLDRAPRVQWRMMPNDLPP